MICSMVSKAVSLTSRLGASPYRLPWRSRGKLVPDIRSPLAPSSAKVPDLVKVLQICSLSDQPLLLHRLLHLVARHGSLPHLMYGDSSLRYYRVFPRRERVTVSRSPLARPGMTSLFWKLCSRTVPHPRPVGNKTVGSFHAR